MRTKTLLYTAALGAAGLSAGALAQVYSVNAVGYVNTIMKPGFNLVANPLDAGANNTVSALLAGVPDGSIVYTYAPGTGFSVNTLDLGEWTNPSQVLAPGTGFFFRNPGSTDITVTFVGEVMQGSLTTPLAAGFNLVASKVPQAGKVSTDLKLPVADGDLVYTHNPATGYSIYTYDLGAWDPSEPEIGVGQAFWARKTTAGNWTREFSVNQ